MASIFRWGLTDGFGLARTVGMELDNPSIYSAEEFIEAAKRAMSKHPEVWVIYYSVSDKYQGLGYYTEALATTKKCVELRPKDIRSSYALATTYNLITRAGWANKEFAIADILQEEIFLDVRIEKKISQGALDRTGLALQTAAVQAIRWFEYSLNLKPDGKSMNQIQMDLQVLYERFPDLKR